MVLEYFLPQVRAVNVHVYFRCSDLFVTEHFLYGAQVGTAFKEMGGEAMAKGVRRYRRAYAGFLTEHLDDMEDGDA